LLDQLGPALLEERVDQRLDMSFDEAPGAARISLRKEAID
jgi:hypothetical protein